jgi:ABC-type branched-subunit amino acid transport system ATPase component
VNPDAGGLEVRGLTVRFGGLTAVNAVNLAAPPGRITALIGPNGAGKTTTFDACSGLVAPTAGVITFAGRDVTRRPPHARCQLGLGRTFQRFELFESLPVRDNVSLGREAVLAGWRPDAHLWARRRERREIEVATAEALERCGIADLADAPVADLSTGQRRLVELARAVAGRSTLLLLDEPSSGLDHAETARFGDVLLDLVAERGVGFFLVEHDMSLVMRICEHIYVLDFGTLIFEGDPAAVSADPEVRRAYLGSAA